KRSIEPKDTRSVCQTARPGIHRDVARQQVGIICCANTVLSVTSEFSSCCSQLPAEPPSGPWPDHRPFTSSLWTSCFLLSWLEGVARTRSSSNNSDTTSIRVMSNENVLYDSDDGDDAVCPLCCEPMDISDRNFLPCPCGYRLCMWCWHRIKENYTNRCPACRSEYSDDPHAFAAVDKEAVIKNENKKKQRAKQKDTDAAGAAAAAAAAREHQNALHLRHHHQHQQHLQHLHREQVAQQQ
ncbi:unnamed protein product, partial [Sphacelaria rigidula]